MRGRLRRFINIILPGVILCLNISLSYTQDTCGGSYNYPVLFWNLENYFDPFDDSLTKDDEFTPWGLKHWTWEKFIRKRNMIAKTVIAIKDYAGEYPIIAAFAECENKFVINQLVYKTALSRLDYGIIHRDSPDIRGIDVAMIYRKDFFTPTGIHTIRIDSLQRPTRDILAVSGFIKDSPEDTVDFYIVHLPSKLGGKKITDPIRKRIVDIIIKNAMHSIDMGREVILTGDFNDGPSSDALRRIPDSLLVNLALSGNFKNIGTIKYNGKWEIIDQFLLSRNIAALSSGMQILPFPFLLEDDNKFLGRKPFRSYYGPRYNRGISDHLPIMIYLYPKESY